jgi:hypothetical protein
MLAGILKLPESQTTDDLRLEALAGKCGLEEELSDVRRPDSERIE